MACTLQHVAIGCNRVAHGADWCPSTGLYAYAAGPFVALWRPTEAIPRVHATLAGHKGRVNTVRWLRPGGGELVSGGTGVRHVIPVVWCGVVWCGMVWYGVVWCGVVWCGVPKALLPKGKRPGCLPTGTGKRAGLCVLCARCA